MNVAIIAPDQYVLWLTSWYQLHLYYIARPRNRKRLSVDVATCLTILFRQAQAVSFTLKLACCSAAAAHKNKGRSSPKKQVVEMVINTRPGKAYCLFRVFSTLYSENKNLCFQVVLCFFLRQDGGITNCLAWRWKYLFELVRQ